MNLIPNFHLAVVVVNYQTPSLTVNAVKSVLSATKDIDVSIVIVDNGSEEKYRLDLDTFTKINKDIHLIHSEQNLGFAGGNNIALRSINADFYLLLNSDAEIPSSSTIDRMLQGLKNDPQAGIIGPRLVDQDGRHFVSKFRDHSPATELVSSAKTSLVDKILRRGKIAITDSNTPAEWVSFACVIIKHEVLATVGLMDEKYFLYYEDADYCYSARKLGWKILNDDSATAIHKRGQSSDLKKRQSNRERLPRYYYESRARYFIKNYGLHIYYLANLCWHLGAILCGLRRMLKNTTEKQNNKMWKDIWIR